MDYEKYTDFENFALEPVSRLLSRKFDDSYPCRLPRSRSD